MRGIQWLMVLLGWLAAGAAWGADGKPLSVEDIMKFREIKSAAISKDGAWITYLSTPDRGDGEAVAIRVEGHKTFKIERGSEIAVSRDGKWIAALQKPSAIDLAAAGKDSKKKEALKAALVIIETENGKREVIERVKDFAFSHEGHWLAIHREVAEPEKDGKKEPKSKKSKKNDGSPLTLKHLTTASDTEIEHVAEFAFAPEKPVFTWVASHEDGVGNGLYMRRLVDSVGEPVPLAVGDYFKVPKMGFTEKGAHLAFLVGIPKPKAEDEDGPADEETESEPEESESEAGSEPDKEKSKPKPPKTNPRQKLFLWDTGSDAARELDVARANFYISEDTKLVWSKDGVRLFFGYKPEYELDEDESKPKPYSAENFWDPDRILKDRELDVWHGEDPFIKTYDKTNWKRTSKQDFLAVYHRETDTWTPLADAIVPSGRATDHPSAVLLTSDLPYRRASTWAGSRRDVWLAKLEDGAKYKVAQGLDTFTRSSVSPDGQKVVFYQEGGYHLFDVETGDTRQIGLDVAVPWPNEDHDYPSAVPGYGVAGWLADGSAVLLYDKYDIWVIGIDGTKTYCLTGGEGRRRHLIYRIQDTDSDKLFYKPGETLLLTGYYDLEKHSGFYQATLGQPGVSKLLEDRKTFNFVAKAKDAGRLLFTREDFQEFPDLWIAGLDFKKPKKMTEENPQVSEFAFGDPELVSWTSADGIPLQGVLIRPGNYEPGRRYPVLVYYYRFMSQRLYRFNQMVINHRPNFPWYTSNGYAVFLPDIRFEVGLPGPAAVKCLVPGVQKIVDMGVADPNAIGLHGHSWSGYQTAFVVTQTDIFAAAVAGAPVSNMTSAYSGIRLGSGLARQFQYEQSQSRIGGSMWDARDLYIENSPVFFADRIETPLLIEFGDIDEAVPWQQGIELYLAMRRLDKEVVFLQYRDEPHHLKKYPNKLDYTLKMKAYFDHYLKGDPAQTWITEGVPYRGK